MAPWLSEQHDGSDFTPATRVVQCFHLWDCLICQLLEDWRARVWVHEWHHGELVANVRLAMAPWLVSEQHDGSYFAWTTRVMSLLLTWNLSHLLFTRGLEGSGMGEMRGIWWIGCKCPSTQHFTSMRLSKQHDGSDFARTTRVMNLLPTCSLTHLLFTKGLEGPGMGMLNGIMVNLLQISTSSWQRWLSKQHDGSCFAQTTRVMNLLPTCSLTHLLFTKGLEGRVWVCWVESWWISCKYPRRHGTMAIETTRWKPFRMNNKSDEPASNL